MTTINSISEEEIPWSKKLLLNFESSRSASHIISKDRQFLPNQGGTARLNFGSGCSASHTISKDHQLLPNRQFEFSMFSTDFIGSSMLHASTFGIQREKKGMVDNGVGILNAHGMGQPASRPKPMPQLTKRPSSVAKAARSQRRMLRSMRSKGFSSASSSSLGLPCLTPISGKKSVPPTLNDGDDINDGESMTITTFDNKTLRFLFWKELQNSDCSRRVVLPKKDAETHLPNLEAKQGTTIEFRDVSSTTVWCMRYRFWRNNNGRMYLLENTGEFMRHNGLKSGDYIMLYEEYKSKKLFILGKKVVRPWSPVDQPIYNEALLQQQNQQVQGYERLLHNNHMQPSQSSTSDVGENLWDAAAVAAPWASAMTSLSSAMAIDVSSAAQPLPPSPAPEPGELVEEPSLSNKATVTERRCALQEVMGSSISDFIDIEDIAFDELDLLPNFGSLMDVSL